MAINKVGFMAKLPWNERLQLSHIRLDFKAKAFSMMPDDFVNCSNGDESAFVHHAYTVTKTLSDLIVLG